MGGRVSIDKTCSERQAFKDCGPGYGRLRKEGLICNMGPISRKIILMAGLLSLVNLSGCADVNVPDARNVQIPKPTLASERRQAVNERPDSVMYLPLGDDFLVPEVVSGEGLPQDNIGPFELRSETLAGALQLILADYDISLAFETEEGLNRRVTVANLKGSLDKVVSRVCSLADLYCSFEDGVVVVKDMQTFTVTLPPIGVDDDDTEFLENVAEGLGAILGEDAEEPIVDESTRTLIYTATQRTSEMAERYFQRLRANTALVVFETYIWEVSLSAGNSMGINWDQIDTFGKFNVSVDLQGTVGADFTNPVSIGLPTTQSIGTSPTDVVRFLSQFGAVKTISQPQITVLSGSSAELRVADTQNFVSEISTTIDDGQSTTSVSTDSVDSGFTLTIGSTWDKSTVYANVSVALDNVIDIEDFTFSDGGDEGTSTTIQLPQTSERELNTQIRVRPGDSVLIAGLVREIDNFDSRGPGFMEPIFPDSRTAEADNLELVILLKPRVVVYTSKSDNNYLSYVAEKASKAVLRESRALEAAQAEIVAPPPERPAMQQRDAEFSAMETGRIEDVRTPEVKSAPVQTSAPAPEPSPVPLREPVSQPVSEPTPVPSTSVSAYPPTISAPSVPVNKPQSGSESSGYTSGTGPEGVSDTMSGSSYEPYSASRYRSGYVSRRSESSSASSVRAPSLRSVPDVPSRPAVQEPAVRAADEQKGGAVIMPSMRSPVRQRPVDLVAPSSETSPAQPPSAPPMRQVVPPSAPQPAPAQPSAYETYDYYTPSY